MFLIGVLIYFALVLLIILTGSSLSIFLDALSLVFVLGGLFAITIATDGISSLKYAFKASFSKEFYEHKQNKIAIDFISLLIKSSIGVGLLGLMTGIMIVLNTLEDASSLGPSISVAMLTIVYSLLFLFLVLLPMKHALVKKELLNS